MQDIFIAPGLRTPFSRIDGALAAHDAIELSVPVVQAMLARLSAGTLPDFVVWGSVVPNLGWSNIARVCGPTPHVELVATTLVELGYGPGSIRTERFGPSGE